MLTMYTCLGKNSDDEFLAPFVLPVAREFIYEELSSIEMEFARIIHLLNRRKNREQKSKERIYYKKNGERVVVPYNSALVRHVTRYLLEYLFLIIQEHLRAQVRTGIFLSRAQCHRVEFIVDFFRDLALNLSTDLEAPDSQKAIVDIQTLGVSPAILLKDILKMTHMFTLSTPDIIKLVSSYPQEKDNLITELQNDDEARDNYIRLNQEYPHPAVALLLPKIHLLNFLASRAHNEEGSLPDTEYALKYINRVIAEGSQSISYTKVTAPNATQIGKDKALTMDY